MHGNPADYARELGEHVLMMINRVIVDEIEEFENELVEKGYGEYSTPIPGLEEHRQLARRFARGEYSEEGLGRLLDLAERLSPSTPGH